MPAAVGGHAKIDGAEIRAAPPAGEHGVEPVVESASATSASAAIALARLRQAKLA